MTDHPLTPERVDAFRDRHIDPYSYAQEIFDAGRSHERTNPEDDRPWEPLDGPVRVGDEVQQDYFGVTTTAVVVRVSKFGAPMTAEGTFIGPLRWGTWYVRRAAQELPTEKGAVIVPADGHEYIEATRYGRTWRAVQAARDFSGGWVGAWRSEADVIAQITPEGITPGTWKAEEK